MTLFGRRVEQLRDQKKLHNKDIAQKAGLKAPEVTKIIKGELHKTSKVRAMLDFLADTDDELAELIIEWLLDHLLKLDRGIGLIEIRKLEESSDIVKRIKASPLPHDVKEDLFYVIEDAMKYEATRRQIRIWTELIRLQKKGAHTESPNDPMPPQEVTTTDEDTWHAVAEDPKKYSTDKDKSPEIAY